jgi:phosphocarrier protein HPr
VPASSEALLLTLPKTVALHARPAAEFVRTAMRFSATVRVGVGEREVDGKSLLSILALGAEAGSTLSLRADGPDAAEALEALAAAVTAFC